MEIRYKIRTNGKCYSLIDNESKQVIVTCIKDKNEAGFLCSLLNEKDMIIRML